MRQRRNYRGRLYVLAWAAGTTDSAQARAMTVGSVAPQADDNFFAKSRLKFHMECLFPSHLFTGDHSKTLAPNSTFEVTKTVARTAGYACFATKPVEKSQIRWERYTSDDNCSSFYTAK
nr:hypothetical protein CFP56_62180 [Quercus suber]